MIIIYKNNNKDKKSFSLKIINIYNYTIYIYK